MQTFIKLMEKDGINFRMLTIDGEADFEFMAASGPDSYPVLRISKHGDYNNRDIDLVGDVYVMNNEGKTISKILYKDLVRTVPNKREDKALSDNVSRVATAIQQAQQQPPQPRVDVEAEHRKLMAKALAGGSIKGAEPKITFNKTTESRILVQDASWNIEKTFAQWVIEQKVGFPQKVIRAATGSTSGSEVYVAVDDKIVKIVKPNEILDVEDMTTLQRIEAGLDPDTNKLNGLKEVAWYEMSMEWAQIGNRFEVSASKISIENKHLYVRARRQPQMIKHSELGWGVYLADTTFKELGTWSVVNLKMDRVFATNTDLEAMAASGVGKMVLETLEANQPDFPQDPRVLRLIHVVPVGENDLDFGYEWEGKWHSLKDLTPEKAEAFVFATVGEVLSAMSLFGYQKLIEELKVNRCILPVELTDTPEEHLISAEARHIFGKKAILGHLNEAEALRFTEAMETALANPQSGAVEVCVEGPKGPAEDANRKTSYLFIDGRFVLAVGRDKTTLPEDFNNRSRSTLEKELLNTRAQWTLGFHWFGLVYNRSDRQVHAYRINVNAPITTQRKDFMRGDKVLAAHPKQLLVVGDRGYGIYVDGKWFSVSDLNPAFIKDQKIWASDELLNDMAHLNLREAVVLALQTNRPINPAIAGGGNMLRPTNGLGDPGYLG